MGAAQCNCKSNTLVADSKAKIKKHPLDQSTLNRSGNLDNSRSSSAYGGKKHGAPLVRRSSLASFGRRSSIKDYLTMKKEKELFVIQTNLFQQTYVQPHHFVQDGFSRQQSPFGAQKWKSGMMGPPPVHQNFGLSSGHYQYPQSPNMHNRNQSRMKYKVNPGSEQMCGDDLESPQFQNGSSSPFTNNAGPQYSNSNSFNQSFYPNQWSQNQGGNPNSSGSLKSPESRFAQTPNPKKSSTINDLISQNWSALDENEARIKKHQTVQDDPKRRGKVQGDQEGLAKSNTEAAVTSKQRYQQLRYSSTSKQNPFSSFKDNHSNHQVMSSYQNYEGAANNNNKSSEYTFYTPNGKNIPGGEQEGANLQHQQLIVNGRPNHDELQRYYTLGKKTNRHEFSREGGGHFKNTVTQQNQEVDEKVAAASSEVKKKLPQDAEISFQSFQIPESKDDDQKRRTSGYFGATAPISHSNTTNSISGRMITQKIAVVDQNGCQKFSSNITRVDTQNSSSLNRLRESKQPAIFKGSSLLSQLKNESLNGEAGDDEEHGSDEVQVIQILQSDLSNQARQLPMKKESLDQHQTEERLENIIYHNPLRLKLDKNDISMSSFQSSENAFLSSSQEGDDSGKAVRKDTIRRKDANQLQIVQQPSIVIIQPPDPSPDAKQFSDASHNRTSFNVTSSQQDTVKGPVSQELVEQSNGQQLTEMNLRQQRDQPQTVERDLVFEKEYPGAMKIRQNTTHQSKKLVNPPIRKRSNQVPQKETKCLFTLVNGQFVNVGTGEVYATIQENDIPMKTNDFPKTAKLVVIQSKKSISPLSRAQTTFTGAAVNFESLSNNTLLNVPQNNKSKLKTRSPASDQSASPVVGFQNFSDIAKQAIQTACQDIGEQQMPSRQHILDSADNSAVEQFKGYAETIARSYDGTENPGGGQTSKGFRERRWTTYNQGQPKGLAPSIDQLQSQLHVSKTKGMIKMIREASVKRSINNYPPTGLHQGSFITPTSQDITRQRHSSKKLGNQIRITDPQDERLQISQKEQLRQQIIDAFRKVSAEKPIGMQQKRRSSRIIVRPHPVLIRKPTHKMESQTPKIPNKMEPNSLIADQCKSSPNALDIQNDLKPSILSNPIHSVLDPGTSTDIPQLLISEQQSQMATPNLIPMNSKPLFMHQMENPPTTPFRDKSPQRSTTKLMKKQDPQNQYNMNIKSSMTPQLGARPRPINCGSFQSGRHLQKEAGIAMNDLYEAKLDENLQKKMIHQQILNAQYQQLNSNAAYPPLFFQNSTINDDTISANNCESTESYDDEEYGSQEEEEEEEQEEEENSALLNSTDLQNIKESGASNSTLPLCNLINSNEQSSLQYLAATDSQQNRGSQEKQSKRSNSNSSRQRNKTNWNDRTVIIEQIIREVLQLDNNQISAGSSGRRLSCQIMNGQHQHQLLTSSPELRPRKSQFYKRQGGGPNTTQMSGSAYSQTEEVKLARSSRSSGTQAPPMMVYQEDEYNEGDTTTGPLNTAESISHLQKVLNQNNLNSVSNSPSTSVKVNHSDQVGQPSKDTSFKSSKNDSQQYQQSSDKKKQESVNISRAPTIKITRIESDAPSNSGLLPENCSHQIPTNNKEKVAERRSSFMNRINIGTFSEYAEEIKPIRSSTTLDTVAEVNEVAEKISPVTPVVIPKVEIQPQSLGPKPNVVGQLNAQNLKTLSTLTPPLNGSGQGSSSRSPSHRTTTKSVVSKRGRWKMINQYARICRIGTGKFSKVYKCKNQDDQKEYAMKVINRKKLGRSFNYPGQDSKQKKEYNFLETEIAILKKIDHPNVLQLYEIIDDPNNEKLFIVTEFIKDGSLSDKMSKKPPLGASEIRNYFRGLISALEYCHMVAKVLHRDIKPENILIGENDVLKLADFGVSQTIEMEDDTLNTKAGTPFYFAPEMNQGTTYRGFPADVWACGVVLYQMALGKKLPFMPLTGNVQELFKQITSQEPDYTGISDTQLLDLLKGIFVKDPKSRLTIPQIKVHPWITDDGQCPMASLQQSQITVSSSAIQSAITKVVKLNRIAKQMKEMKIKEEEVKRTTNQASEEKEGKKAQFEITPPAATTNSNNQGTTTIPGQLVNGQVLSKLKALALIGT